MNDELPLGWEKTTLGEICSKPQYGWTCKASKNGHIKFLRTTDISCHKIDWTTVPFCDEVPDNLEKYRVRPDDILVARAGSVGVSIRVKDVPCEAVFASYLIRFNALNGIEPKFVEAFLKSESYWIAISEFTAGIAIPNVNATKLASLVVPVAPSPEQHRIVAKLEKLLGQVEICQKRLAKIPILLKRFRHAVLAAACSGRLTADWREDSSATSTLSIIDREARRDFPNGWSSRRIGEVLENLKYGTATKCVYEQHGVPVLRIPNVVNGKIDHGDIKYAELSVRELNQLRLEQGDILVIRSNGSVALVGRSAVVGKDEQGFAYAGYLIRLRPNRSKIEPYFLNLVLASFDVRLQIELKARSTSGVNNINSEEVRALRFKLPPLPEQKEILNRVETLFALADKIEARLAKTQSQVAALTPSLLARAFRGELVPQDPNDEPASVLMERIKEMRPQKANQGGRIESE